MRVSREGRSMFCAFTFVVLASVWLCAGSCDDGGDGDDNEASGACFVHCESDSAETQNCTAVDVHGETECAEWAANGETGGFTCGHEWVEDCENCDDEACFPTWWGE